MKLRRYERFGVGELWIVDPGAELVEVRVLEGRRYGEPRTARPPETLEPTSPPGFVLSLEELLDQA